MMINDSLNLEKKGEEWLVNKDLETRKTSILFILKIIEQRWKSNHRLLLNCSIRRLLKRELSPVRVKVFEKSKILKSFLVYKTASNIYGNIMKLRESSKPFIVFVPGNEVEIGSAFTLNELFWQPYYGFQSSSFRDLFGDLENIADTGSSFRIKNENPRIQAFRRVKEN